MIDEDCTLLVESVELADNIPDDLDVAESGAKLLILILPVAKGNLPPALKEFGGIDADALVMLNGTGVNTGGFVELGKGAMVLFNGTGVNTGGFVELGKGAMVLFNGTGVKVGGFVDIGKGARVLFNGTTVEVGAGQSRLFTPPVPWIHLTTPL